MANLLLALRDVGEEIRGLELGEVFVDADHEGAWGEMPAFTRESSGEARRQRSWREDEGLIKETASG